MAERSSLSSPPSPSARSSKAPGGAASPADPDAFRALYEQHVVAVYRYCHARLRDPALAEDATSEVFLKAWERRTSYRGGSFAAWLIAITRTTVVDVVRRRPLVLSSPDGDGGRQPADPAPGPEDAAVAAEEHARLLAAMEQLSEDQRAVLELQLAGWRGTEIAEALAKTPAAVKVLRQRALHRLRVLLEDERLADTPPAESGPGASECGEESHDR